MLHKLCKSAKCIVQLILCVLPEHVLRKIHHGTFRSQKLDSNFQTTIFTKKISIYPAKFPNDLFCHCPNSLLSLHISIHHCTFCASLHVKTSPVCYSHSSSFKLMTRGIHLVPVNTIIDQYKYILGVTLSPHL